MSLFFLDDAQDTQDNNDSSFTINQNYAQKYEAKKKHEELSALREKYGDVEGLDEERLEKIAQRRKTHNIGDVDQRTAFANDQAADYSDFEEDTEDEEEDEHGEMVTPEVDVTIMHTLARIKGKDPEIYNEEKNFFGDDQLEKARNAWKLKQEELKNSKPVTLKDYHRQTLLESGGMVDVKSTERENTDLTFHEEQAKLKNELKSAIAQETDDAGDEFFTKRAKSSQEIEKEEDEYRRFLIESMNQSDDRSQAALREWRNFKNNPDIDKDESFLMDYILNRGWIDKSAQKIPSYNEIVDDSEDEEAVERADRFESSFNHRFEEEGGAKIVTHARDIEGTIRRKDNTRKLARQSVAERKAEEKLRQQEELKRLKNLKKEEIRQKLLKIQEVAGIGGNSSTGLGLEEVDLEEDFDPEKHDMVMSKSFSDNYYNDQGANVKPVFDDDIDISDIVNAEELKFNPAEVKSKKNKKKKKKEEPKWKEDEFNMDADYVPDAELCDEGYYDDQGYQGEEAYGEEGAEEAPQAASKKKRSLDDFLGEYYQLDYEDMIGDLPTRFKYGQTSKTDYGLTPAEILMADDADLNEYYSLKKLAPFRAAHKQSADRSKFKSHKQKRLREFRQKLLTNVQADPELSEVVNKSQSAWAIGAKPKVDNPQEERDPESIDPKKQKRNEKRRERAKKAKHALEGDVKKEGEGEDREVEDVERKKKRRKKSAKRTTE